MWLSAVASANPFLRDMTVADMIAWSDRKMRGCGAGLRRVAVVPVDVQPYRETVDALLGAL